MNHLGDTNKMVDTPRMNAARNAAMEHMTGDVWCVGCQLERELNAANVEIEEKHKDVVWLATEKAKLENYAMLLEEAGDALYENSDPTKWDLPEANARKLKEQKAWRKAKEAKP